MDGRLSSVHRTEAAIAVVVVFARIFTSGVYLSAHYRGSIILSSEISPDQGPNREMPHYTVPA
jgi:hypothetical protein